MTSAQNIGESIEGKLDALQAKADPRVFDQAVELLQLVSELYGAGLARVLELADRHAPELVDHITADELLASLLVANGLHPDDVTVRIAKALEGVRPFLAGHGGDVELLDIDERVGAVRLRLLGSCDGCPSSAITLRTTVERAILDAAPEIAIIDVEEPSATPATSVEISIVLGTKPAMTFDPATGCGAAFESDMSVT
ncbi:MAG: NifU family protein [Ilumatobacteraceae bacterium]